MNNYFSDENTFYFPLCNKCVFYMGNSKCSAFPEGIPEEILTGEHDHTKPYPGDNGIRFEPVEDE